MANIMAGLELLNMEAVLALLVGTLGGMVIGALPGFSATMGVSLLLPISFGMDTVPALIMLTSIYTSAVYGGSITAILCHTPGTSASAATAIDGYELTKKGRGMEAVGVSTVASCIGGVIGAIALLLIAPPLGRFSLRFGPLEYFFVAFFGCTIISTLAGDNMIKGLFSAVFGLFVGSFGCDALTGIPRYTFGILQMEDGINITPALIGLFSISQIMILTADVLKGKQNILDDPSKKMVGRFLPPWHEFKHCLRPIFVSGVIGTMIGIIPAAGGGIAAFTSYSVAKNSSKDPNFGKGSFEGVAASESANNACAGGALIPMLTLGIPGSAVAAVLLGGLEIHGIVPGATLFTKQAPTVYSILIGYLLCNILMAVFGLLFSKPVAKLTILPIAILIPMIPTLCAVGSYAIRRSFFDVIVMVIFGLLGFLMRKCGFATAPMILGMILSEHLEFYFRRAMILARGDMWNYFLHRPVSIVLAFMVVITFFLPLIKKVVNKKTAV